MLLYCCLPKLFSWYLTNAPSPSLLLLLSSRFAISPPSIYIYYYAPMYWHNNSIITSRTQTQKFTSRFRPAELYYLFRQFGLDRQSLRAKSQNEAYWKSNNSKSSEHRQRVILCLLRNDVVVRETVRI